MSRHKQTYNYSQLYILLFKRLWSLRNVLVFENSTPQNTRLNVNSEEATPGLSHPDHRETLFLYGIVDQGMNRGWSSISMSMLCSSFFYYVGVLYESQLEAAGNRRL